MGFLSIRVLPLRANARIFCLADFFAQRLFAAANRFFFIASVARAAAAASRRVSPWRFSLSLVQRSDHVVVQSRAVLPRFGIGGVGGRITSLSSSLLLMYSPFVPMSPMPLLFSSLSVLLVSLGFFYSLRVWLSVSEVPPAAARWLAGKLVLERFLLP